MGLIEFLLLATVAYLVWRISDQLPDLLFRISEIQRDVADIRKRLIDVEETTAAAKAAKPARKKAARKSRAAKSAAASKSAAANKSAAKTNDNADTDETPS